jgi:hypothetical protein
MTGRGRQFIPAVLSAYADCGVWTGRREEWALV